MNSVEVVCGDEGVSVRVGGRETGELRFLAWSWEGDKILTRKTSVRYPALVTPPRICVVSVSCFGIENFEVALRGRLYELLI
jgi:hypothetical protein